MEGGRARKRTQQAARGPQKFGNWKQATGGPPRIIKIDLHFGQGTKKKKNPNAGERQRGMKRKEGRTPGKKK